MFERTARQVMTAAAHDLRMRTLPITMIASALGGESAGRDGRPTTVAKNGSARDVVRRLAETLPPEMARRAGLDRLERARIVDLETSDEFMPARRAPGSAPTVAMSRSGDRRRMGEIVAERIRARRAERGG